jgi:predicted glutamine amidotransferase
VPLACLLRIADPPRGVPRQARSFADRPEPARQAGRDTDERRRLRRRLVRGQHAEALPQRPSRLERLQLARARSRIFSPLFFARIRASTGRAIQETNTHPFRHGRWLWTHNGLIREFPPVKRELALAIEESLFPSIESTTDSETMFYLAITFGLEDDPVDAVERMVGFVEETGQRHRIEDPIQMTVAMTDGRSVWVFRYSSEGDSRTSTRARAWTT